MTQNLLIAVGRGIGPATAAPVLSAASTICYLSKKKDKDGTDVVGNILKVKMQLFH